MLTSGSPNRARVSVLDGHAEEIFAARRAGVTLREIGDRFGVTRERVRQWLVENAEPELKNADHVFQVRREQKETSRKQQYARLEAEFGDRVGAALVDYGNVSAVAAHLGVPEWWVNEWVDTHRARWMLWNRPGTNTVKRWEPARMLDLLRVAYRLTGEPLSVSTVNEVLNRNGFEAPTPSLWYVRFGSFTEACRQAGVPCTRPRRVYTRVWTDERLIGTVARFGEWCKEHNIPPSRLAYEQWQRTVPGAPSWALLRLRFGSVAEIAQVAVAQNF